MALGSIIDKWSGRASNLITFWPLIPAGVIGGITAYFSTSVAWINSYGAFGWWTVGLFGFLIACIIFLISANIWDKVERAKAIRKWKINVDHVNPLSSSFEGKRISLHDLVHPAESIIGDKQFNNCQLVGPANIAPIGYCSFKQVKFINCSIVVVKEDAPMLNVVGLSDCHVIGGEVIDCIIFTAPHGVSPFKQMGVPFLTLG